MTTLINQAWGGRLRLIGENSVTVQLYAKAFNTIGLYVFVSAPDVHKQAVQFYH